MSIPLVISLDEIGIEVARELVRVTTRHGAVRLSTPLLYPGGSCVGVEISGHRDGFLVGDMGAAAAEADTLGVTRRFARVAGDMAARYGVRFDRGMIYDLVASKDDLAVVVLAVANAAKSAVDATLLQIPRDPVDARLDLWTRLDAIFREGRIQRSPRTRGSSDEWTFDAAVEIGGSTTVFEIVAPNPAAVAGAVTKFLDLRELGDAAPGRVAILPARTRTPHLGLLAKTARLLDQDAPEQAFRDVA